MRHDEEHLRRFLAARARGDAVEMRRWWDELVIDFYDRMDALVYLAHRGRLDAEEHQEAVSLSMTRFSSNLIATFRGSSIGQLVNASKRLAWGICIDVQRHSARARGGASLDSEPGWEVEASARAFDASEQAAEARDFLAWALPQLKPERRRVLELTLDGVPLPELARELGISHDNAYQRRSRAMKDLRKLKERYDA